MELNKGGLAYVGKIVSIEAIPNADFIVSATVVCGKGGKWKGVVKKDMQVDDLCIVFLPDALIPEDMPDMDFMKHTHWRVKMRRFKGAPSEVVIMPTTISKCTMILGNDITLDLGVTKYCKPVPAHLQGKVLGEFPGFIPKTDELHWQAVPQEVEKLQGQPFYITEKCDGSSTTAYKYKGHFGVCSRNWELAEDPNNGYWQVALEHKLPDVLPDGYALQWETCGPGIQQNPMGVNSIRGFAFNVWNIVNKCYLEFEDMMKFCQKIGFPLAMILRWGRQFPVEGIELLGEGTYLNGNLREGVVVRSQYNLNGHHPVSFKVINLKYET